MIDVWASRADLELVDVGGHTVLAPDGEVGVVDGLRSDPRRGCLVVDVPLATSTRSVVVPVGLVERVDPAGRRVVVGLSRAYVVDGPEVGDGEEAVSETLRTEAAVYYLSAMASPARVLPRAASVRGASPRTPIEFHPAQHDR